MRQVRSSESKKLSIFNYGRCLIAIDLNYLKATNNLQRTTKELKDLLENTTRQQQLKTDYQQLKELLSKGGNASANAAAIVYETAITELLTQ